MKIGFYRRNLRGSDGGAYAFQSTVLSGLLRRRLPFECAVISESGQAPILDNYMGHTVEEIPFDPVDRRHRWLRRGSKLIRRICGYSDTMNPLEKLISEHRIDLLWLLGSFEECRVPTVVTLFDLQHRVHPYFPEVSRYGWRWEDRERYYRHHLPRASAIICGTATGKREALAFYGLHGDRVHVFPFPVPDFAHRCSTLPLNRPAEMPEELFSLFYPAQFWPHKNHILLLDALRTMLHTSEVPYQLVLAGSAKENRPYIEREAERLGIRAKVRFTEFVSEEHLAALYRYAHALVYPSFFGPDNLPPLEAFALGCPVIAAQVEGAREQLDDAALYFDPLDSDTLAAQLNRLAVEPSLRAQLIETGRRRISELSADRYVDSIVSLVDRFERVFRCWDGDTPEAYQW